MATGSHNLTSYYAKRIIADSAAATATNALLQTGTGVLTDIWILHRTNRATIYGIKYLYDNTTNGTTDRLEVYGGYQEDNTDIPTAWVQMDTGDLYIKGRTGLGYDPTTSGNTYKLYVDGTSYYTDSLTIDNGGVDGTAIQIVGANNKIFSFKLTNPSSVTASNVDIGWDWASGDGAGAAFRSSMVTDSPGYFTIYARNSTTTQYSLIGGTNGALTWDGSFRASSTVTAGIEGVSNGQRALVAATDGGRIVLYINNEDANGARAAGLWISAHGTGAAKTILSADTDNNINFYGNATTATHLSSAPNNTTTFYRGDKTWTNTLGGAFTANGTITANGGYLKSTLNGNTVQIGSQNTSYCHITNSVDRPFWFNKSIYMGQGATIGAADTPYRPFKLFLGRYTTSGSNALNANSPLIEFSNSDRSQYCQLIYDDWDSLASPDSLTLVGNQNGIKFICKNGPIWIQGGSNAGGNINRLETSAGMPGNMQYNQSRRGTQIYANGIAFCDPYNGNSNSDAGWIRQVETTGNSGYLEIATGDDGNEPIYIRQYNTSNAVARTFTILDGSGNSTSAGNISVATYTAGNTYNSSGSAIEVREVGRVGSAQSAWTYAPKIGFHWSGRVALQLGMNSSQHLCLFNNNSDSSYGTLKTGATWGNSVLINSNWIGFYNAIGGATRYGYIQCNADRMYFRKENGASTYHFDFGGHVYTNNNMYADGNIYCHGVWANRTDGERQVGVDAGTTGTFYLYSNGSTKGLYSSTGYRTGAVITITSTSTTFYGNITGSAASATSSTSALYVRTYASLSGNNHALAVKSKFDRIDSSFPNNQLTCFYSSAYGNGSLYMGYKLSGYDSAPYGGFYVCHYNNAAYVGIQNGGYTEYTITKTAASSKYIKENIQTMTDEDGKKLLKLNPVSFDYKKDYGEKNQYGFIAEEVLPILSYPVICRQPLDKIKENPTDIQIDYIKFIPYIIKLAQVQQKEIDTLKQKIQQLETKTQV